jgi:hypothetical protein
MGKLKVTRVIEALQRTDGNISAAATLLRCSRSTVHTYIKTSERVAEALREVRERWGDVAEGKLREAVERGESWAICFFLKCQFKARGYIERPEPRPAPAVSINFIEVVTQARANALARRAAREALSAGELLNVTPPPAS